MELLLGLIAALALVIGAIVAASFLKRPAGRQPSDLAAGSNKPDDRNAFGPERDSR